MNTNKTLFPGILVLGIAFLAGPSLAMANDDATHLGFKVRAGGRYDNVRMCVGSDPGVKGGPAMDMSLYVESRFSRNVSIAVDIPVMRPILFAAAFSMLQFEPDLSILFRKTGRGRADLVAGPTVGISMHYGPDYMSDADGSDRTESFAAMGPRIGAYLGVDFKRPDRTFNFQLGIHPYVTPLFAIDDADDRSGIVAGGTLDALFRFGS